MMGAVTISEQARALIALEEERRQLWREAQRISDKQMLLMVETARQMVEYSREQAVILQKMALLDEACGLTLTN